MKPSPPSHTSYSPPKLKWQLTPMWPTLHLEQLLSRNPGQQSTATYLNPFFRPTCQPEHGLRRGRPAPQRPWIWRLSSSSAGVRNEPAAAVNILVYGMAVAALIHQPPRQQSPRLLMSCACIGWHWYYSACKGGEAGILTKNIEWIDFPFLHCCLCIDLGIKKELLCIIVSAILLYTG